MLFLIFATICLVGAGLSLILLFIFQAPLYIVSVISFIIYAVLFFALDFMHLDVKRHKKRIAKLQESLNECREKLGLKIEDTTDDDMK